MRGIISILLSLVAIGCVLTKKPMLNQTQLVPPKCIPTTYPISTQPSYDFSIKHDKKYDYMQKCTVGVITNLCRGTGFIIYQDNEATYIITDEHVIDWSYPLFNVEISIPEYDHGVSINGKQYNGQVIDYNKDVDLALIKVNHKIENIEVADLVSKELPAIRTKVYSVGYPSSMTCFITDGVISRYFFSKDKILFIQVSAATAPGGSGGPIFTNDLEVIGIVDSINLNSTILQCVPNFNNATSSYEIVKWLKYGKYRFVVDGK